MTDRAMAKALASKALRETGVVAPPVDLDDIARSMALRIERHATLEHGVRAAYRPDDGLVRVIDLPPRVERFPLAHEIGHAILGDGGRACTDAMIREQADAVSLAEALEAFDPEAAASAIGSQLLVPSAWLTGEAPRRTIPELEELFDVTRPVIVIAIIRDHLLNKVRTS